MSRALACVIASAAGFVAGYVAPAVIFLMYGYLSAPATGSLASALDGYVTMLYLAGMYGLAGCVCYAAIAAFSRNWRQRPVRKVVVNSALAGFVAVILKWTSLAVLPLALLIPLLPRNAAMVLVIAMPGIITGLSVLVWFATRGRPPVVSDGPVNAITRVRTKLPL